MTVHVWKRGCGDARPSSQQPELRCRGVEASQVSRLRGCCALSLLSVSLLSAHITAHHCTSPPPQSTHTPAHPYTHTLASSSHYPLIQPPAATAQHTASSVSSLPLPRLPQDLRLAARPALLLRPSAPGQQTSAVTYTHTLTHTLAPTPTPAVCFCCVCMGGLLLLCPPHLPASPLLPRLHLTRPICTPSTT